MSDNQVLYEERGRVALITLDSAPGNAIGSDLAQGLLEACRRISENDEVQVVVVTGKGDFFCCGSRLEEAVATGASLSDAAASLDDEAVRYEVSSVIGLIDRPVIAAINGDAFGQGLELALACDVRIAAEEARFGFPSVATGLMPMDGGTQRLPRIVGKGRALEMILSGQLIGARQALDIGLVSQVVPANQVMEKVEAMSQTMATKAPISLRYVKEAVNKGMDLTLDQGIRLEADLYFLIHTTEDRTEGIRAFQQKRKPEFKGR
jgi:enoyl-CoA hydratase/carnithine racemase